MYYRPPSWLSQLEKKFGNWGLPNLAWYLIILQVFGFLVTLFVPHGYQKLILNPDAVFQYKEFWRLFTFLAVPISQSIFILFALWFLYFVVNALEKEWGEFYTTFYLAISILLTILFSLIFQVTIPSPDKIYYSLFLAVASLFPDFEILLFFIIPVPMKWLGFFTAILLLIEFIFSTWLEKIYMILVFSNYFLFFGQMGLSFLRNFFRRN